MHDDITRLSSEYFAATVAYMTAYWALADALHPCRESRDSDRRSVKELRAALQSAIERCDIAEQALRRAECATSGADNE